MECADDSIARANFRLPFLWALTTALGLNVAHFCRSPVVKKNMLNSLKLILPFSFGLLRGFARIFVLWPYLKATLNY